MRFRLGRLDFHLKSKKKSPVQEKTCLALSATIFFGVGLGLTGNQEFAGSTPAGSATFVSTLCACWVVTIECMVSKSRDDTLHMLRMM